MFIGPVNKKILGFGVGVVAILQFFQFANSSFEVLVHQFEYFIQILVYILLFSVFWLIFEFVAVDSVLQAVAFDIGEGKNVEGLILEAPAWECLKLVGLRVFHLPVGHYLSDRS